MYEENRKFSWTNLFIKAIIVLIFILFTVWLLSLSNKGLSNSLNVLTDDIFTKNIERMKEVGKDYFTTERLPQKVGEVETLTLGKMYDEHLILELKDKYGNTCSAKNSYVSIEKMENEYQMKVYLECGEEEDYIIVIMGCYDYCDTDICERKEETSKEIEYEYSKTTGGRWTDYGKWSEWSKVSVTKNNYRQVETKVEKENYSYDKVITEAVYKGEATCPNIGDGFTLTSQNGNTCNYNKNVTDTQKATCPAVSGYSNTGISGNTCSYSKTVTDTQKATCPSVSGYTNTGINGDICSYSKTVTDTKSATCPSVSGYTNTGISGNTCNYRKSTPSYSCPSVSNYTNTSRSGSTCYYRQSYKVAVGKELVSSCTGCSAQWQTIYETRYNYTTRTANVSYSYSYKSKTATCSDGYTLSNGSCTKTTTSTDTKSLTCPSGYMLSNGSCTKSVVNTTTKDATCPSGYMLSNGSCTKTTINTAIKDATCPIGQNLKDGKCYENVTSTVTVSGTKDVTYYRYRVREYIGGTTDYKWSKSKNDQDLINAGYKLTGRTR